MLVSDSRNDPDSRQRGLERLLADSGVGLTTAEVGELIRGVAAAPVGYDPDAWMTLLGGNPTPTARALLAAMLDEERGRQVQPRATADEMRARLTALRGELARDGLAGFIVPRGDEHQGEYVALRSERLAWLTGFTGSAGTAVVLREKAAIFVDGRYTTQAGVEVDEASFAIRHVTQQPLAAWLEAELPAGARLGYDPWLHTPNQVASLEEACSRAGARAVAVEGNLLDAVWTDQPPPPLAPVVPHDEAFAGRSSKDKRALIAEVLRKDRHACVFLAQPDSIAWLLNIRGGDVPFTPLPLAFALLHADEKVELFLDPRKLTPAARSHLGSDDVTVQSSDALADALARIAARKATLRLDPDAAPSWVAAQLGALSAAVASATDPCQLPKATKTQAEVDGIRAAHLRDGVALTRFLAWLPAAAEAGSLHEIAAAERLGAFRAEGDHYRGPSFPTISAAAAHGAIVHYRASPETDRRLAAGSLYLVDSGGQYLDGTTDVTRTVAVGEPTEEMRQRFTLVLKGHIALATACFPAGTTGSQLDALARSPLWKAGLDYDHGTGHGVGCFLGVHEGPQRISKLPSRIALQGGMVVSNEPGYYKPNGYGIRIENLVVVTPVPAPEGGEQELLGFETLTLAPIDRNLIVPALLDEAETGWLNAYHTRVRDALAPLVDETTRSWLEEATRPL